MATKVISIIDPTGSGDYLNLDSWKNDRRGDIVVRDTIEVAALSNRFVHASGVSLLAADWTVDEDHYIEIMAASGWEHPGVFDNTKSYCFWDAADEYLDIQVGWTRIGQGMCIYGFGGASQSIKISNINEDAPVIVDRLISRNYGGVMVSISACSGSNGHIIKNCEMLNGTGSSIGVQCDGPNSKATVYNSTIIMDNTCLKVTGGGTLISQNNYLGGHSSSVCYGSGVTKGTHDMTYNSEASGVANRNIALDNTNFYFYNEGAPGVHEGQFGIADFHLPSGSALIGQGADLSAVLPSSFRPTVGIDSQPRVSYDVGCDEFTVPTIVTKTIGPSGDYTSFSTWKEARKGNLATRDTIERVYIAGSGGEVRLENYEWGTNNKNYIIIEAAAGFDPSGIFDVTKAYFRVQDGGNGTIPAFACGVGGTRVKSVIIDADGTHSGQGSNVVIAVSGQSPAPMIFDSVVGRVTSIGGNWAPILIKDQCINYNKHWDSSTIRNHHILRNCVLLGVNGTYAYGISLGGAWKIYNNAIILKDTGNPYVFTAAGALVIENNNYLRGKTIYGAVGLSKGANTATFNTEADSANLRNIVYSTDNFISVTAGAENLHIKSNSALIKKGATISVVIYDMDGQLRVIPYDIGPDQVSFGGIKNPILFSMW